MKPTCNGADSPLLNATDAAVVRELMIERNRILQRLRDLDAQELAAMIPVPLLNLTLQTLITG